MSVISSPNITLDDALQETVTRFCRATSTSRERHRRACNSLPGGNTRTVLHYAPYPVSILKGEGARLWDVDGNVYTDFLGEYTAGLYGHSNPKIQATIRAALDDGIVLCAPNTYESELASLICARFSSCQRVRFCNSGTEANLMALSAARVFTKRDKILVLEMLLAGFYQARRGFMSLSLPLETSDCAGFLDAFAEFIDTHGRLIGTA